MICKGKAHRCGSQKLFVREFQPVSFQGEEGMAIVLDVDALVNDLRARSEKHRDSNNVKDNRLWRAIHRVLRDPGNAPLFIRMYANTELDAPNVYYHTQSISGIESDEESTVEEPTAK